MANQAIKKIITAERHFEAKMTLRAALALVTRYFVGYEVSRKTDFLHKANFVLSQFADSPDISVMYMQALVAAELGDFSEVGKIVGDLHHVRKAMEHQDTALYACFLYFNCILAISREKERAANKHYRTLADYCSTAKPKPRIGYLLLAAANCAFHEYGDALQYLHLAYKAGENSPFFYICLTRVLKHVRPRNQENAVLLPLLRWGLGSGAYLGDVLAQNDHAVEDLLQKQPAIAERLYREYPLDWILNAACMRRMIDNDLSESAFYFYKEAEARQLHFQQLYDFLIRAAHKNGIEDVSRYSLVQYFKREYIPQDILPFVYHLALKTSDGRHEDLLERIRTDILEFACHAIDNRLFGRYYYSMYRYLLEQALDPATGVAKRFDTKYIKAAEEAISNLLFAYELTFETGAGGISPKRTLAREQHIRSEDLHEIRSGRCRINLWGGTLDVTCFDEGLRSIVSTGFKKHKLVENVDVGLMEYFFSKNPSYHTPELLVALGTHHMAMPALSNLGIAVLREVIAPKQSAIDPAFKMQARVTLGNYYAGNKDYSAAVAFYRDVDETKIDPRLVEQMLVTYIHAGEADCAIRLASRASEHISGKNLFHAIRRIVSQSGSFQRTKALARLAYNQLVSGWYDRGLLALVLDDHVSDVAGWIMLAKNLAAMGTEDSTLFARILDAAIEVRNASPDVQNIFAKLTEATPDHPILPDYAMFLCHEILVSGLLPSSAAISALEINSAKTNDDFVAYALAHIYIRHDLVTSASVGILWPIFKEIKDKSIIQPYIEESTPFVYMSNTRAGNTSAVCLHYRTTPDADFKRVPMKYLRFGIYNGLVPHFYGEELEYFFEETRETGSIRSSPTIIANNRPHTLENPADLYYIINSAIVFEQMFKYDSVEEILSKTLAPRPAIRAKLMTSMSNE